MYSNKMLILSHTEVTNTMSTVYIIVNVDKVSKLQSQRRISGRSGGTLLMAMVHAIYSAGLSIYPRDYVGQENA